MKLIFDATLDVCSDGSKFFRLTGEGITRESFTHNAEQTIIDMLGLGMDDKVVITIEHPPVCEEEEYQQIAIERLDELALKTDLTADEVEEQNMLAIELNR